MPPANTTKPAKKSAKPAKQIKQHNWRISDAAYKILAKDWTIGKDEHHSDVFERVLAFANAAKGFASTMELPIGQIAPETLLDTFTTKFHTLSEYLKKIQDASIRQAPPVELLPFARRVLELSSKSGTMPPAQLQDSLMRLAIDAIAQAEGSPTAAPGTDLRHESPKLEHDKPSFVPTVLPHPQQQTAPAPATTSVASVAGDGNGADAPASKNRNTLKAEAKLKKALDYLIDLNEHTTNRSEKWVINSSLLFSLTGCFRPAVNTFIEAHQQTIDELNRTHGLGPGHNRARTRTQPNAISDLVKKFKESVLGQPL